MHMTPDSSPLTASRNGYFGTSDGAIRKYDAAAGIIWELARETEDGDGFHAAAPTSDGGAVAVGSRLHRNRAEHHNWDAVLVRLDRDGKQVWRRDFDGGKRGDLTKVALLPDGSIIAVGYATPEGANIWKPWIMRLNSEGRLE